MSDVLIGLVVGAPIGAVVGYFGAMVSEGKKPVEEVMPQRITPQQLREQVLEEKILTEEDLILRELEACDDTVIGIEKQVVQLKKDNEALRAITKPKSEMPRCGADGCNRLARRQKANDGKHYCKLHLPEELLSD